MITSYEFGKIVIGGNEYVSDVIIFPEEVIPNWWREEGHTLSIKDLEPVFERKPKILVIGTGYSGLMKVPNATADNISARGIELHTADTRAAVGIFNDLIGKSVAATAATAAAFHLTC